MPNPGGKVSGIPVVLGAGRRDDLPLTGTPIRIVLVLEVQDESLVGNAATADGEPYHFTGWLGLLNVLQAMLPASRSSLPD